MLQFQMPICSPSSLLQGGSAHGLHCCVVEVGGHLDLEVRVFLGELVEQFVGLVGVGAGESADERQLQVDQLSSLDDAVGNGVALHDSSEDVNQDSLNLRVRGQDLECDLHLLHVRTASDVQKVGWLSALELDDVHGGHSETCAIDHAADVSIKCNVVEASSDCLVLVWIDVLGGEGVLLEFEELLLPEFGVVIDADLGVNRVDLVLGVDCPGVDLELDSVALLEKVVKVAHLLPEALDVGQVEVLLELVKQLVSDASIDLDHVELHCVRVVLGNFLNLHAALGGGDDGWSLAVPVEDEGKVDLSDDVNSLVNEHGVDLEAVLGGLVGDQVVADHLFGEVLHLLWSLEDLHSALEAAAEGALSTPTRVHLRLEDEVALGDVEVFGDSEGLLRSGGDVAALDENAVFAHEVLGLVLVEVEEPAQSGGEGLGEEWPHCS